MIFWKSTKSLKRVDFFYCAFHKHWLFWSSKANWPRGLRFSLPSIILTDLSFRKQNFTLTGSKGHGFWFVIGRFPSVLYVSVFQGSVVSYDRNYDWRQPKTQLWRRRLNFRVGMFLKSTVRQKDFKGLKTAFFCVLLLSFVLSGSTSVYLRRRGRFVNSAFQQEKFGPKIEVFLWQTNLKANVCRNSTFQVNWKKNATGRRRVTSSNRAAIFVSTSCEERHNKPFWL